MGLLSLCFPVYQGLRGLSTRRARAAALLRRRGSASARVAVAGRSPAAAAPEPPALGDMVLRHKGLKFGSDNAEAHVGVLMEISQSPGSRPKGKILVANELVEIEIADVIVLQRRDEK